MDSGLVTEQDKNFTLDEVMSTGYEDFKRTFWRFLGLLALAMLVSTLPALAGFGLKWLTQGNWIVTIIAALLSLTTSVLGILMQIGVIKMQIGIVRGEELSSDMLWQSAGRIWSYLGASICFALVVVMGTILFVVPGIIMYITFQFYPYFIIEHKMGPIKALKASADITEGVKWELFFLGLILLFLRGLGQAMLLIGAIPADMFAKLALTRAYTKLLERGGPDILSSVSNKSIETGLIE